MVIKRFQECSLKDYEGKIGPILFFDGCNFRCGYCHAPDFVLERLSYEYSIGEIIKFIKEREKFVDGVTLCGGEPTLQENLVDIVRKLKETGISVKLDTNGSNPDVLEELFSEKLIDYVAMDIKTSPINYNRVTNMTDIIDRVARSAGILTKDGVDYEFRTTVVPGIVDKEDINLISHWLGRSKKYVLQQFNNTHEMIDPEYKGIKPYSEEQLKEFLEIAKPHFDKVQLRL